MQDWMSLSKEHGSWDGQIAWTGELLDQILIIRKEGKSQSEVAKVMGCTMNAVRNTWIIYLSKEHGSWIAKKIKAD
jgi:hypothetical protein